jgi:hypothetical protein
MTYEEHRAREAQAREAFARLHARATTAAVGDNVVVAAGDLQVLLNMIGPPPLDPPADDPPPASDPPAGDQTTPPAGDPPAGDPPQ